MQRFLYDILHIVFDRSSVTALAALTHAQLFLLLVNEYVGDVICEFFYILKYLHEHIMPRL